ncbi:hypothetical protein [Candidatus Binatus sp.]|uniref:hypothetical protein n=1 Tax=Candidatus Binatus sp. TaxID=2811406 RepID=UPI003CA632DA
MAKINITFEIEVAPGEVVPTIERMVKAVPKADEANSSSFDRRDAERRLLEAYQQNAQGYEWWMRADLHKGIFGRFYYSAAALYKRGAGLFELRGDRYFITDRGRARLAELQTASAASA